MNTVLTIFTVLLLGTVSVFCTDDKNIVRARIESCPSCKLNRLSEVKSFIYDDVPKYDNVVFKKIQGANPELLFLNEADEVVEKHSLEPLNRESCNKLLQSKGFSIRKNNEL